MIDESDGNGVSRFVEKFGTTGAVLAALVCPICFPKLAIIGAAMGLGTLAPFEPYAAFVVQALFIVAFLGQYLAYRTHRRTALLAFSGAITGMLFVGYYVIPSSVVLQSALAGLVGASVWQYVEMRRCARCAASHSVLTHS